MNQVTIQWDVVIALYIFFNWCHGGIVFLVLIVIFYSKNVECLLFSKHYGKISEESEIVRLGKLYAHKNFMRK